MNNRYLLLVSIPILLLAHTPMAAAEDDKEGEKKKPKVVLPSDFKKCAIKVFKGSTDVTEVLEDCEAEMNAYVESLQPVDDSTSAVPADAVLSGGTVEATQQTKLAKAYEECVISVFDETGSEQMALKACEKRLAIYLATIATSLREQMSTLILAAVHKALARRSLGEEG